MTNKVFKVFTDKIGGRDANTYIGTDGELFYDPSSSSLRVSDNMTPGGHGVGVQQATELVEPARANYEAALNSWRSLVEEERQSIQSSRASGGPLTVENRSFVLWDVTGENVAEYIATMQQAWLLQNAPASPPTVIHQYMFYPITASLYSQIMAVFAYIEGAYEQYQEAASAKRIVAGQSNVTITSNGTVTIPPKLTTYANEDLHVAVAYAIPSSPPGTNSYAERNWIFTTSGALIFPNGSAQTGASISLEQLKTIVANSTDFAGFKSALLAL